MVLDHWIERLWNVTVRKTNNVKHQQQKRKDTVECTQYIFFCSFRGQINFCKLSKRGNFIYKICSYEIAVLYDRNKSMLVLWRVFPLFYYPIDAFVQKSSLLSVSRLSRRVTRKHTWLKTRIWITPCMTFMPLTLVAMSLRSPQKYAD